MISKVLEIKVKHGEVDQLIEDLRSVKSEMNQVEGESKKADNALKKVGENGGAIATLDSLTGGAATRIRDAFEATKLFNFSLKGTRTALLATGVGAFVVALGAIVAYWDEIVDFVGDTNGKLERQIELLERKGELLEAELGTLELQEKLLGLQGQDTEEIRKKKIQVLQAQLGINGAELTALEIQKQRITQQKEEANFFDKVLATTVAVAQSAAKRFLGNEDTLVSAVYGDNETLQETEDKINDLTKSILNAQIQLQELRNGQGSSSDTAERGEDQEKLILPLTGVTLSELEELGQQEFDAIALQQNARTRLEEEQSNIRKLIAEREALAKIESFRLAADGFSTASRLIGKETAAGKAFSVASTLIATYLSAQQAYASQLAIPTPDAPARAAVAASIATATGLANVQAILRVPTPDGGGGAGTSRPGGGSVPPAFNVVDSSAENQLNKALLEGNDKPIETFIVDKNVTSAQEARRNKIESSSFG